MIKISKILLTMKLLLLCLLVGGVVSCSFENVRHLSKSENSKAEKLIPFEEIKVNAAPVVWKKEVHPFLGATPIDIDGDVHFQSYKKQRPPLTNKVIIGQKYFRNFYHYKLN